MSKIEISDEAVEVLARRLHRSRYTVAPVNDEHDERRWTQLLFDDEREEFRRVAREHLTAAYPLLRQQWEADFLERLKAHGGDQWLEGYEAGCSMSHSLGCDAVEAQRDALVEEVERLRSIAAGTGDNRV
jgi:hypothetical protein